MKIKNYALVNEGNHEYDISVIEKTKSTTYEMRYSESDQWTSHTKGEHILSAIDDGNGIRFTEKISKKMDYDFFTELRLFMEFINTNEGNISSEFKTYELINQ